MNADPAGLIDDVVKQARARARSRVIQLRSKYVEADRRALADRLVTSFSRRAGLGGAATGALSLVSLPIGLPAGIALTLAVEAELLLSLLELYGIDTDGDAGRVKLYALWAGTGAVDVLKNLGLQMGANAVAKFLAESLPAKLVGRLHPLLVKLVVSRLGLGWVGKALKFWPIVGAPIGYLVDSAAVRALGRASIATLEEATRVRPVAVA